MTTAKRRDAHEQSIIGTQGNRGRHNSIQRTIFWLMLGYLVTMSIRTSSSAPFLKEKNVYTLSEKIYFLMFSLLNQQYKALSMYQNHKIAGACCSRWKITAYVSKLNNQLKRQTMRLDSFKMKQDRLHCMSPHRRHVFASKAQRVWNERDEKYKHKQTNKKPSNHIS